MQGEVLTAGKVAMADITSYQELKGGGEAKQITWNRH
jgi:hypothetical protein